MRSAHVPGSGTAPVDMAPVIGSNPVMVKPGAFAAADMPACAPLLRGAGKVARRGGWGVESRSGSIRVRSAGRAIRLALKRATPHPALRATFPQQSWRRGPTGVESRTGSIRGSQVRSRNPTCGRSSGPYPVRPRDPSPGVAPPPGQARGQALPQQSWGRDPRSRQWPALWPPSTWRISPVTKPADSR